MEKSFNVKSRIWFTTNDGTTFLGEGRVRLLKQLEKHGSISKAAKSMNMSYKKAWNLVDSMNKNSSVPLVVKKVGGMDGGGTVLSEEGKKMIAQFSKLNKECQDFLDEKFEQLEL